jgi:hypothetical protein
MASYKIAVDNSTLGTQGTTITEEDIAAAPADLELLLAAGIVEPTTKTTKEKD